MVLLRRAGTRASPITCEARPPHRHDDRLSDALVRRSRARRRRHADACDRPLRSARRPVVRPRHPGAVPRRAASLAAAIARVPRARTASCRGRQTGGAGRISPPPWASPGNPAQRRLAAATSCRRASVLRAGLPTPDFAVVSLHRRPDLLASRPMLSRRWSSRSRSRAAAASCASTTARSSPPRSDGLRALMSPDIRIERDAAHDAALIESFIPGDEFAIEGVLTDGAFPLFAIFDKPDPLDGPFFEETIYVTPSRRRRRAAGDRRGGRRAPRGRSVCVTARSTPSAASTSQASTCSKCAAAQLAVCARAAGSNAIGGAGARLARGGLCCGTRLARTSRAPTARAGASGVMMIPIPAARRLPRCRRAWTRPRGPSS